MDSIRVLLSLLPSGDKAFWHFSSGGKIGISSNLPGTNWIKYKILKWIPYGIYFAECLRGINHFGILVSWAAIDISRTLHGTDWIKHKILKWIPCGISAFVDSIQGINMLLIYVSIIGIYLNCSNTGDD